MPFSVVVDDVSDDEKWRNWNVSIYLRFHRKRGKSSNFHRALSSFALMERKRAQERKWDSIAQEGKTGWIRIKTFVYAHPYPWRVVCVYSHTKSGLVEHKELFCEFLRLPIQWFMEFRHQPRYSSLASPPAFLPFSSQFFSSVPCILRFCNFTRNPFSSTSD